MRSIGSRAPRACLTARRRDRSPRERPRRGRAWNDTKSPPEQQQVRLRLGQQATRPANRGRVRAGTAVEIRGKCDAERRNRRPFTGVDRELMRLESKAALQARAGRAATRASRRHRRSRRAVPVPSLACAQTQRATEPSWRMAHAFIGSASVAGRFRWTSFACSSGRSWSGTGVRTTPGLHGICPDRIRLSFATESARALTRAESAAVRGGSSNSSFGIRNPFAMHGSPSMPITRFAT